MSSEAIKMACGAKVLRATLYFDRPGTVPHGVALCEWERDFVVWNIYFPAGAIEWEAEQGEYFAKTHGDSFTMAMGRYDARRGAAQ